MSKYDEMKEFYERRIDELKGEVVFWRNKAMYSLNTLASDAGKIKTYEKILSKLLDSPNKLTDTIVMFEGKSYRITGFNLNHEEGKADTLSVECIRVNIPA